MPPGYAKTIRKEILYEYAKLISRSALGKINHGFVNDQFKKLRVGQQAADQLPWFHIVVLLTRLPEAEERQTEWVEGFAQNGFQS